MNGFRASVGKSLLASVTALLFLQGCQQKPVFIPNAQQHPIDRSVVEYPAGYELKLAVRLLNAPTAMAIAPDGTIFVAENGLEGDNIHIFGFKPDGARVEIYPRKAAVLPLGLLRDEFRIYAPVGGMIFANGRLFVSHRDRRDRGVITSFDLDGVPSTVVADLPAEGDYSVTDLAMHPDGSRLYFGIGSYTNSGVVGQDNWDRQWLKEHRESADVPAVPLRLLGYRFDTPNPRANWFTGEDIAVTAPFQPFGTSKQTWVPASASGKPSAAIYSVSPTGGDLRIEAHGIRYPRGLAFNEYGRLYASNNGMEMRGTRPVLNDPDTLLRVVRGTWYGWPDYSADLQPITDAQYQPPAEVMNRSGYPEVSFLIDHQSSGLLRPDRHTLLQATFPVQSGAAHIDFVPQNSPFFDYRGSAIVALWGSGQTSADPHNPPVGRKVVQLDVDSHQVRDFIYNTRGLPASILNEWVESIERPADVKFGPDGSLYILDTGYAEYRTGRLHKTIPGTGKVYRLERLKQPRQP